MIKVDNISFRGLDFKIVRDDLFPEIGGGNKARKALEYESDALAKGRECADNDRRIQSNHCRAIAILCARRGWRCKIVYHGTRERFESEKGNALVVRLCGAETEFVGESEISSAMDNAMLDFRSRGFSPYYVRGGGHDICGGMAYVKAVAELSSSGFSAPDYIFHASGTGSTQAGIFVGLEKAGWKNTKVVGFRGSKQGARDSRDFGIFGKVGGTLRRGFRFVENNFYRQIHLRRVRKISARIGVVCSFRRKETGILFDTTYSAKPSTEGSGISAGKQSFRARILFCTPAEF